MKPKRIATLIGLLVTAISLTPSRVAGQSDSVDLPDRSAVLIGQQSCGGSTCHGGRIGIGPDWNHSLSTFLARDPHASAGLMLLSGISQNIVRSLDREATYPSPRYDQVLRQRCISCHATVSPDQCVSSQPLESTLLATGVSCESCHGAASQWVAPHLRDEFDRDAGRSVGFRDN